ncbi:6320_t:CDS:1, partial [Cetraspora pellucida]
NLNAIQQEQNILSEEIGIEEPQQEETSLNMAISQESDEINSITLAEKDLISSVDKVMNSIENDASATENLAT